MSAAKLISSEPTNTGAAHSPGSDRRFFGRLLDCSRKLLGSRANFERSRKHLALAIAGNQSERARYEQKRALWFEEMPPWAQAEIERKVSDFESVLRNMMDPVSMGIRDAKIIRRVVGKRGYNEVKSEVAGATDIAVKRLSSKIKRDFKSISYARAFAVLFREVYEHGEQEIHGNPSDEQTRFTQKCIGAELRTIETVVNFMIAVRLLEDFLLINSVSLPTNHKMKLALRTKDCRELLDHPHLQNLLSAQMELADVFVRFSASEQEQENAISRLVRKPSQATKTDIIASFRASRGIAEEAPSEAEPVTHSAQVLTRIPIKKLVRSFVETELGHLSEEARSQVIRRIIDLDTRGLMDIEESFQRLRAYSNTDHGAFMEFLYLKLRSDERELSEPATSQSMQPKLPAVETPQQVIARLDSATQVSMVDINFLRKALRDRSLPEDLVPRAIEHVLLSGLARGGKRSRQNSQRRIRFDSLSGKVINPGIEESSIVEVAERLVSEGKLVNRNDNPHRPRSYDPVKISGDLRFKYAHRGE